MKNVIIGTAGHIDHGKTCLIKALTGTDTDRLKEEKERGITIELGFAELPNDRELDIGIIDVPGHEKFVRHMLAGIGGIDIVLLIVAADEGFMPQTKEHFEILKMLDIDKGIVVITKTDMVDEEWLEVVREDVADNTAGTFLEGAPVAEVSSRTGEGIEQLRELIIEMASGCGERREDMRLLRLPVDRVFTIDGFGTVVTGTLMEGCVETGEDVMLYPSQKKAKVRNIQVHGKNVGKARAGQRTAVNLTGLRKDEISRGDVLVCPGALENTWMADVRIDMFDSAKRVIKSDSRLHFYYGAAETVCKAVLLDKDTLSEGESCYAQLRFEEEIAVKRGDRFILRFYSPMETIGGGVILDAGAAKKKRFDAGTIESLRRQDKGDEETVLEEIFLEESRKLPDIGDVIRKFGYTMEEAQEYIKILLERGVVEQIGEVTFLHESFIAECVQKAEKLLNDHHSRNPVSAGMPKEEFRSRLAAALHTKNTRKTDLLAAHMVDKELVNEHNGLIAAAGFTVTLTDRQKEIADRIERIYKEAGMEPPAVETVLAEFRDRKAAEQIMKYMSAEDILVKLDDQHIMHRSVLDRAVAILREAMKKDGKMTLAGYRDLTGTSRKYAMMILEYTDRCGISRMEGDYRVLCSR